MRYVLNDGNPLLCHSVHVKPGNQNTSRIRTGSCIPPASTDNDLAPGVLSALVQRTTSLWRMLLSYPIMILLTVYLLNVPNRCLYSISQISQSFVAPICLRRVAGINKHLFTKDDEVDEVNR